MPRKVKKVQLLGDDEGAPRRPQQGGDEELGFTVNEDFAKRFEHNKRREDMHRLEAKLGPAKNKFGRPAPKYDDESESSSDEEEEDDGFIPEDQDAAILDTLLRIKRKDPLIYQPDVHFFEKEEEEGGAAAAEEAAAAPDAAVVSKSKPLYLKDVIARQALEHGPEVSSSDDEADGGARARLAITRKPRVYDNEQEQLRQAFLSAAQEEALGTEGDPAFGGVLEKRKKKRAIAESDGEEEGADAAAAAAAAEEAAAAAGGSAKKGKKSKAKKLTKLGEAYFGSDEAQQDAGDRFLKKFILQRGWVDADDEEARPKRRAFGDGGAGAGGGSEDGGSDEGGSGLMEDDEHLEDVDRYEAAYNFRYEEPGAARIVTHPREVEGTVRKEDDRRKKTRAARAVRQAEQSERVEQEVKRLKNLKKRDIEDRLSKVRRVAGLKSGGATTDSVMNDMLEGDFDPDQWDRHMAQAFGDDYYDEEDGELAAQQGDEDMGGGDEPDDGAGDEAALEGFRALQKKLAQGRDAAGEGEAAGLSAEQSAVQRASLQQMLSEYYALDYEDSVGGVRTRFRYKEVPSANYGLAIEDILSLDDKDLNQVAGLKRLAPYRDDVGKERPNYKALQAITAAGAVLQGSKERKRNQNRGQPQQQQQQPQQPQQQQQQPQRTEPESRPRPADGGAKGGSGSRPPKKDRSAAAAAPPGDAAGPSGQKAAAAPPAAAAASAPAAAVPAEEQQKKQKKKHKQEKQPEAAAPPPQKKQKVAYRPAPSAAAPQRPKAVTAEAARLASYAPLTLKKDEGDGRQGGGSGGGSKGGERPAKDQTKPRKTDVPGTGAAGDSGAGGGGAGGGAAVPAAGGAAAFAAAGVADGLSKAARKNAKRGAKRAATQKGSVADAAGVVA